MFAKERGNIYSQFLYMRTTWIGREDFHVGKGTRSVWVYVCVCMCAIRSKVKRANSRQTSECSFPWSVGIMKKKKFLRYKGILMFVQVTSVWFCTKVLHLNAVSVTRHRTCTERLLHCKDLLGKFSNPVPWWDVFWWRSFFFKHRCTKTTSVMCWYMWLWCRVQKACGSGGRPFTGLLAFP